MSNVRKIIFFGDIYNNLVVISDPYSKTQGKTSRKFVKVRCSCGLIFESSCTRLRTKITVRCKNCSFEIRSKNAKRVTQAEQVFRRLVLDRSKKHNINVEITVEDYERISKKPCFYCGDEPKKIEMFSTRKYVNNKDLYMNGIDRIDSSVGYTSNNCVACCTSCNYAKHTLTLEDFIIKVKKIYSNLRL